MGVDETLLESVATGGVPCLRFYRWSGPWLSLGYAQALSDQRRRELRAAGIGLVRRATGGGAVLHGNDLTYMIAVPAANLPAGLVESHARLSTALRAGLRQLGIDAGRSPGTPGGAPRPFDCFSAPIAEEIVIRGRKVAGSAQRRVRNCVLQHGSIRVFPDSELGVRTSGLESIRGASLRELDYEVSFAVLVDSLSVSFSRVLGVSMAPSGLSPDERRIATRRGFEPPGAAIAPRSQGFPSTLSIPVGGSIER